MVELFVVKETGSRAQHRKAMEVLETLGTVRKADGGECGNMVVALLVVTHEEAPLTMQLLKEEGYRVSYSKWAPRPH